MSLQIGETFVHGLDRQTAQDIMAACRTLGVDRMSIRTTDSGFVVPNDVWDEVERATAPRWAAESAVF